MTKGHCRFGLHRFKVEVDARHSPLPKEWHTQCEICKVQLVIFVSAYARCNFQVPTEDFPINP
jgi:hypothetical protein